jgi:ubiquinone/menaquinone biosynthesis C-methylase UbiE
MKLNLGSGLNKQPGYTNVDNNPKCKPELNFDLNKPWPIDDNEVTEVKAERILEHLDDLTFVMGEIWRVCKPGAIVEIVVPSYKTEGAYADPTHKRFFTLGTFDYFTRERRSKYYFDFYFSIQEKKILNVGAIRNILANIGLSRFLWNTEGEYYFKLVCGKYRG